MPITTMPILILGATGRTGSLILLEALRRGHKVTALVRTPQGLEKFTADLPDAQRANLTVVRGTPLSAADTNSAVSTALATATAAGGGGDASSLVVISALSPRRTSENPWAAPHPTDSPPRMMADSIANTITALRALVPHGVQKKIIHISALGVGATGPNANWLVRAVIDHSNFRLAYEDHEAVDEELRAAAAGDGGDAGDGIRWVVPRPARLTNGDEGDQYKIWPLEDGMVWLSAKSSMVALAKFSLDAAEGREWDGKDPIVLS